MGRVKSEIKMDIQSAVNFLVGSVLFSVSLIVIGLAILALNNLFSRYWKSIKWQIFDPHDITVVDHKVIEELKHSLEKQKTDKKDDK